MTPLVPLLALMLAGPLRAADNVCPGWPAARDLLINQAYNQIRLGSTYALASSMSEAPVWFPLPKMTTGRDGRRVPERNAGGEIQYGAIPPVFQGAGALAFAPNIGLNKGNGKPVVAVTTEIFDLAHTVCEAAFVMAHEFAHLEKGHPEKLDKEIARQFDLWSKNKPDEYWETAAKGQGAVDFRKERGAELAAFQQPLEDEADARGFELMAKAYDADGKPCDKAAASKMMLHAHEWVEAYLTKEEKEANAKGPQDHRAPLDRAKTLAEFYRRQSLPDGWYQ